MSGIVRFITGDWTGSSSSTRILFDLLIEHLPDNARKAQIVELYDNNVLMLDLRKPSEADLIDIIVEEMPAYLATYFDADLKAALTPAFEELSRLALAQRQHIIDGGAEPTSRPD